MSESVKLPESCPPSDASTDLGTFYRFVAGTLGVSATPTADDWTPPHAKRKGPCVGKVEECECHAHSLYSDLEDVVNERLLLGSTMSKKAIARVDITPADGLIRASPLNGDSHVDYWPSETGHLPQASVVMARLL